MQIEIKLKFHKLSFFNLKKIQILLYKNIDLILL